ncbi:MAG: hypothetical protein ACYDC2_01875 [Solirubrobacteraceae bacterium]
MTGLLAQTPALPLHTAGKYVAGAYVVLFAMVLVYLGVMAIRTGRIERDLHGLLEQLEADKAKDRERPGANPVTGPPPLQEAGE